MCQIFFDFQRDHTAKLSRFFTTEDIIDCRDLGQTINIPRTLAPGNENQYMAFKVKSHSREPNILHEDIEIINQASIANLPMEECAKLVLTDAMRRACASSPLRSH